MKRRTPVWKAPGAVGGGNAAFEAATALFAAPSFEKLEAELPLLAVVAAAAAAGAAAAAEAAEAAEAAMAAMAAAGGKGGVLLVEEQVFSHSHSFEQSINLGT